MNEEQSKNTLLARQGVRLRVGVDDEVWAYSGSTIYAHKGSIVHAFKGSKVYTLGAIVNAYEGSQVCADGSAVVNVAEPGAKVDAGDGTTIKLGCGVEALVKAKANVHPQDADHITLGWGSRGGQCTVICHAGATVYGGIGNTLYVESGAIYH